MGFFHMSWAAGNGQLKYSNGLEKTVVNGILSVCLLAALTGHLEALKWARENGCSWDSRVYSEALHNNHFELAAWARENGCLKYVIE